MNIIMKGYFNFTNGFGNLVESEDDVVNKIIEYVEDDCVMEDTINIVDDFLNLEIKN